MGYGDGELVDEGFCFLGSGWIGYVSAAGKGVCRDASAMLPLGMRTCGYTAWVRSRSFIK